MHKQLKIIRKEVWDQKYSILVYSIIALLFAWMYVAIYPSFAVSAAKLQEFYDSFPKALYQALGIESLSINSLEKFLALEYFSFVWPIMAILLAVSRAGRTIAGEIEKRTMGLFLSLPIKHSRIFWSKYIGSLLSLQIFVFVSLVGILPITLTNNTVLSYTKILGTTAISALFVWAVFAVSMFLSAIFSERSRVYMAMGGFLLASYVVNVVASLQPTLSWMHRISVFYYYNAQGIMTSGEYRLSSFVVFGVSIVLFSLLGAAYFSKRDIVV